MEYTLLSIYYLLQSFFNLIMTLEVVPGVTIGGIIIAILLFTCIFIALGLMNVFSYDDKKKGK